jgi:V/A-type H+-transporting ATPase subunit C
VSKTPKRYSDERYTATRSFALKGKLLQKNELETLAESRSLEELVNRLKGTPYSVVVSELSPPYSARKLELAFRKRVADLHYSLMNTAKNEEILQLYYLRNLAWNLKIALKSKALGRSYDETVSYMDLHAEELIGRRELLAKVLSAKDIPEAANFLAGTEFGKDIAMAASAYQTNKEVRVFDLYVDHALFSQIAAAFSFRARLPSSGVGDTTGVRDMIAVDLDAYNALSILRAKLWGLSIDEARSLIILPTFDIPLATLQKMLITESVQEAAKMVSAPRYMPTQPLAGSDEETIATLESKFVGASRKAATEAFLWQGFGIGTVLAFIKLLEFEVRNLSALGFGVEAGLPAKTVISSLDL